MKQSDLKLLERIFDAEINNRLPAQIHNSRLEFLERDGMVCKMERTLHFNDNLPPTHVKGWQLTELGRFTYCQSCPQ